jgi:hypothetical protein
MQSTYIISPTLLTQHQNAIFQMHRRQNRAKMTYKDPEIRNGTGNK